MAISEYIHCNYYRRHYYQGQIIWTLITTHKCSIPFALNKQYGNNSVYLHNATRMLQCSSIYGQVLKTYFQHVCIQGTLCSTSLLMRGHFRYNFIAQLMFTRMLLGLHFASAHIWTALLLLPVCTQTTYNVSLLYRHRQAKWK